ncbi:MAG: FG-GAP repeat domain-containing protein [Bacteroidota bacterium]
MQFVKKVKAVYSLQRFFWISSLLIVGLTACSGEPEHQHWLKAVPENTIAVITPEEDATISSILDSEFIPFLDDISSSAIPITKALETQTNTPVPILGMLLYPVTANQWQPVWIGEVHEDFLPQASQRFFKEFTQNNYHFQGQTIHKLHVAERELYAAQLNEWILISESSFGVEECIRSYLGSEPSIQLKKQQLGNSKFIFNTPHGNNWIQQLSKVTYRPMMDSLFQGTQPVVLDVNQAARDSSNQLQMKGTIPVSSDQSSALISALSGEPAELQLDRYISANAAAFSIFRMPPRKVPPTVAEPTALDSLLLNDRELYDRIYATLDPEFALVMYEESGYLSEEEYLWIRHLSDYRSFYQILRELSRDGYIDRSDDVFHVSSTILGQLISSEMGMLSDFYLGTSWKGAIISKRKGLTESVKSDRSRRRVIYYDEQYMKLREYWPEKLSGFVMANSERFRDFIDPFLSPDHYVDVITSKFDVLTMTFQQQNTDQQREIAFTLNTYMRERNNLPYEERWIYPLNNVALSGKAVLADIGGSVRDEVIFATSGGQVSALASDGTTVLETSTGTDKPIGSPVVYDWYGNGQDAIMIAAGNKVYAWNTAGELLPKFPFELDERITTPLSVVDITRDGIPEIVVATADRTIHVLNGRGNDIEGWPHTTNTQITRAPVFKQIDGQWSLWSFSGNTLHAWQQDGSRRPGYPKFIKASFAGQPVPVNSQIYGNSTDGNFYVIGTDPVINDTLNALNVQQDGLLSGLRKQDEPDSVRTEAVYVSNSSLVGTPSIQNLTLRNQEDQTVNELAYLTASANGSIFILNKEGQLRYTQSMGQPTNETFSPLIYDIYQDGRPEVINLASFGRLYAWEILSDQRMYSLPTTAMSYPVFVDLDSDGYTELIAQTKDGLRCWSLSDQQ